MLNARLQNQEKQASLLRTRSVRVKQIITKNKNNKKTLNYYQNRKEPNCTNCLKDTKLLTLAHLDLSLQQWFQTEAFFPPGNIFGCYNLAEEEGDTQWVEARQGMLLNILQGKGQPLQQRINWPKMSVVPALKSCFTGNTMVVIILSNCKLHGST